MIAYTGSSAMIMPAVRASSLSRLLTNKNCDSPVQNTPSSARLIQSLPARLVLPRWVKANGTTTPFWQKATCMAFIPDAIAPP